MLPTPVQDGRAPRLWIEALAFARTRLRTDGTIPWTDAAELPALHARLEELLRPDVLAFPVGDFYAATWDPADGVRRAPGGGLTRPGTALRTMLTAEGPRALLLDHLAAIGDRRPVGIEIPSPSAWAVTAGRGTADDGAGTGGRAAAYVAGFLRSLGEANIGHVLVGGPDGVDPAELEPLVKVAAHFRWRLGVHGAPGPAHFAVTSVDAVLRGGTAPDSQPPFHLRVPGDADPDVVLDRVAVLREGAPR